MIEKPHEIKQISGKSGGPPPLPLPSCSYGPVEIQKQYIIKGMTHGTGLQLVFLKLCIVCNNCQTQIRGAHNCSIYRENECEGWGEHW